MTTTASRSCWDFLLPTLTVTACLDEFAFLAFPELRHGAFWHAMLAYFVIASLVVLIATPLCSRRGLIRPQAVPENRGAAHSVVEVDRAEPEPPDRDG